MSLVTTFPKEWYNEDLKNIYIQSIVENPYIPLTPYNKQKLAILYASKYSTLNQLLVGAGGYGGKTYLGSMLAVQYLPFSEDYTCLVTRRNYGELLDTNSVWDNLINWCCDEEKLTKDEICDFKLSPTPKIISPNGNTIFFKAFDHEKKKQKFKSASYDRCINDEASEMPHKVLQFQYRSMRNTSDIPLAIINLSNPSEENAKCNEYLIEKFVNGSEPYIAMDWRDNPYIDKRAYEKSLNELDPISQQYQKYGNWFYKPTIGDLISREDILNQLWNTQITPSDIRFSLIGIDLAGKGKDKFAICRYDLLNNGLEVINDFNQTESSMPEDMLLNFVEKHNPNTYAPTISTIVIEQEGGGSPLYAQRYFQELLQEFNIPVVLKSPKGSKYQRARPLMRMIKNGNVKVLSNCNFLEEFIDESISLEPLGKGRSPNLVDSCSLAHNYLHEAILRNGTNIHLGARIG